MTTNKRKTKKEYSKIYAGVITGICLAYLGLCIILDRAEIGVSITECVVAVALGYFLKAYLGKRNEENNILEREKLIRSDVDDEEEE